MAAGGLGLNVRHFQTFFSFMAITSVLMVFCAPSRANVETWSFNKATQGFETGTKASLDTSNAISGTQSISKTKNSGKSLSLASSAGTHLKIAGFSDTKVAKSGGNKIQSSKLTWASGTALGIKNKAEKGAGGPSGANKKANRSIDSFVTRSGRTDSQYDMLLLEFDTAVSLDALTLEFARGGDAGKKTADLSILAYTGEGSSELRKNTWAQVLSSGSGNGFDSVGNYSNVGLSYYAVNTKNVTSTKWLIGVYNPTFGAGGDAGDDAFRLASIETSRQQALAPTQEVPVPGTLTLLMAGLFALRWRRGTGAPR